MKLYATLVKLTLLLSILRVSFCEELEESYPRVNTPLGMIEGYYKTSSHGRRHEAYEGIPYASPPTMESRFEVATSVSPWIGVLKAKQSGPVCMQLNAMKVEGSEDCLYLNIYTPIINRPAIDLLPVIFFIHGGAFATGAGITYGPKYLENKNVTLVTINYRLGPLGFLSTEDEVVPGNMGLKDQVIALRWVKDNIESFGGDPSRITISGHSAGGASVHYHYLTNLTTGLFHRGMSLSGTALNSWAQTENSLEKTKKLATIVGCPSDNTRSMVTCLKDHPAHQIVKAVGKFNSWHGPVVLFGPVVEKVTSDSTFINRSPVEILASGEAHDLPWITGVTSGEGMILAFPVLVNESLFEDMNDNWKTIAPNLLDFNYTIEKSEHPVVARLMKQDYLGSSSFSRSNINQTIQMITDRIIVGDTLKAVRLHAQIYQSPVWFYRNTYRGAHSLSETLCGSNENFGVCHGDDLSYVWDIFFDSTTTAEDRSIQDILINFWVSFATEGTPDVGVAWPEVRESTEDPYYLEISGPQEILIKDLKSFYGGGNKSCVIFGIWGLSIGRSSRIIPKSEYRPRTYRRVL